MKRHGASPNLGASLFGKGRCNVLAALFANPEREMYLRHYFLTKVLGRPKIMLIGDEHGLARLAGAKRHSGVRS